VSQTVPAALGAFDAQDTPSMDGLRACVHCGICLPQCPTYRVLGEEMDSPRGRVYLMRAAAEDRIGLTPTMARHLDLCLGCRACETACPSGVPFGQLLEATRGQLERHGVVPPQRDSATLRFLLDVFPYPNRLGPMLHGLRLYQWSGMQAMVRGLGLLAPFAKLRAMEALLPPVPASAAPLPTLVPARGARARGRVGVLLGCAQRFFYPDVNADTVRLLAAAGYEVVVPREQECCGALHLHAGRIDDFRAMARRLMPAFRDVDLIVVNAAGCGSALKEYGHWLPDDAARLFAERVRDVSEVLAAGELPPLRPLPITVTYHDACHLAHGQRVRAEPRSLLRRIPELTLVDLPDSELCCGSAGVYNLLEPEMAGELGRRKAACIRETGARVVTAGNPGCLMQIRQHCRAAGLDVEVVHPVTLLARALG
jgi:glycolate dehydrogenase iron-sulfur subunit